MKPSSKAMHPREKGPAIAADSSDEEGARAPRREGPPIAADSSDEEGARAPRGKGPTIGHSDAADSSEEEGARAPREKGPAIAADSSDDEGARDPREKGPAIGHSDAADSSKEEGARAPRGKGPTIGHSGAADSSEEEGPRAPRGKRPAIDHSGAADSRDEEDAQQAAPAAAPAVCTALMLESRFTFKVRCPLCDVLMEWAQWSPPDSSGRCATIRCNGADCILAETGRGRNLLASEGRYSCERCDKDYCEMCGTSAATGRRRPGADAGPGAAAGTAASIHVGGAAGQAASTEAAPGRHEAAAVMGSVATAAGIQTATCPVATSAAETFRGSGQALLQLQHQPTQPEAGSSKSDPKKRKVVLISPPSVNNFPRWDPRRHQEKHFQEVAALEEFKPSKEEVHARRSNEASVYRFPTAEEAAKVNARVLNKRIRERDKEEYNMVSACTRSRPGGATAHAAEGSFGLDYGWAPVPSALNADLTDADLGKLWGGQLHESQRAGECVPSALLALLRHMPQQHNADSMVPSLLKKLEAAPDPLQAARLWLHQYSGRDSSQSLPGTAMRLGLLHHGLRSLKVSLLLLQSEHKDQERLASFRIFRLGSPRVPVLEHTILLYNSCRTHVACLTLPLAQHNADNPTMLASCMRDFSTLPVVELTSPLLNLCAAGDTAEGAMPSTDLPSRLPSFCTSISGNVDHNGQAHGHCSADLAWSQVTLTGEWTAGLPHGNITLCRATTDQSTRCFTIELCTEEPYSPDYHKHPSRVAPGFLWPRENPLWCGRRVLTFVCFDADGGRGIERTYAIAAEGESHLVTLTAVDRDGERVGGLPPRAAGGKLERCVFTGAGAKLCLRLSSTARQCVIFEGSVRGSPYVPFARFGAGVLYAPVRDIWVGTRKVEINCTPSKGTVGCLRGTWCCDKWVDKQNGGAPPLTDATNPRVVYLVHARECETCHSASPAYYGDHKRHCQWCFDLGLRTRHGCAAPPSALSAVPDVLLTDRVPSHRPNLSPAQRSRVPSSPAGAGTAARKPAASPRVFELGSEDGLTYGLVDANISFYSGKSLGGAGGAKCVVGVSIDDTHGGVCFARTCRGTLVSRITGLCPHQEELLNYIRDASALPGKTETAGGSAGYGKFGLDAFYAVCISNTDRLPARRACGADFCARAFAPVGLDNVCIPAGSKRKESPDPLTTLEESEADHRDDDTASETQTHATSPFTFHRVPTIQEILKMPSKEATELARRFDLDVEDDSHEYTLELTRYTLAEHFHPGDVSSLPQAILQAHKEFSNTSSSPPPSKRRLYPGKKKFGGATGRSADGSMSAALHSLRDAERTRWCVNGALCTLHTEQLKAAAVLSKRLCSNRKVATEEELVGEGESASGDGTQTDDAALAAAAVDVHGSKAASAAQPSGSAAGAVASSGEDDDDAAPMEGITCAQKAAAHASAAASLLEEEVAEPMGAEPMGAEPMGGEPMGGKLMGTDAGAQSDSNDAVNAGNNGMEILDAGPLAELLVEDPEQPAVRLPEAFNCVVRRRSRRDVCRCCPAVGCEDVAAECEDVEDVPVEFEGLDKDRMGTDAEAGKDSNTECAPEVSQPTEFTTSHTISVLSYERMDQVLYCILLARQRGSHPVIQVGAGRFSVVRTRADECSYSCPGGYSMVSVCALNGQDRHIPRLEWHCTCSEFRNCRTGMGGRSRTGASRSCTCCEIVILALLLDSPSLVRDGVAPWVVVSRHPSLLRRGLSQPLSGWAEVLDEAGERDFGDQSHGPTGTRHRADNMRWARDAVENAKRFPEEMDKEYSLLLHRRTAVIEALVRDGGQPVALKDTLEPLSDALSAMCVSSNEPNDDANDCALATLRRQLRAATAAIETEMLRRSRDPKDRPDGSRDATVVVCEDDVFPALLCCDLFCSHCIDAAGEPYRARPISRRKPHEAWVFVGSTIQRQNVTMYMCPSAEHPTDVALRPAGVEWSTRTGYFNVGDRWFFSLLVLEDVTRDVRDLEVPPTNACEKRVQVALDFMRTVCGGDVLLPDLKTATEKMYDAWYAYEIVLKEWDAERYGICKFCGILPPKVGTDACAKVAMNLGTRTAREQLDFESTADQPLWTQEELLRHCNEHLVASTTAGGRCTIRPIPTFCVPPLFLDGRFAAETVVNTERDKQPEQSPAPDHDAPHVCENDRSCGCGTATPSTACLQPMGDAVYSGRLDPVKLRDGGYGQTKALEDLLEVCGCPESDRKKLKSDAAKRRWLLKGYETLKSGDSDCHLFTCVNRGTGGAVNVTCPHGVLIAYKWLFLKETNRDHTDVLRSLVLHPAVHFMDDSCGQVRPPITTST